MYFFRKSGFGIHRSLCPKLRRVICFLCAKASELLCLHRHLAKAQKPAFISIRKKVKLRFYAHQNSETHHFAVLQLWAKKSTVEAQMDTGCGKQATFNYKEIHFKVFHLHGTFCDRVWHNFAVTLWMREINKVYRHMCMLVNSYNVLQLHSTWGRSNIIQGQQLKTL